MHTMDAIEPSILSDCLKSVSVDANSTVRGIFVFPTDFTAFDGHFPDQPVLPAVVQMAAVRLLASRHFACPLIPVAMQRTKFKSIVLPEMRMTVSLEFQEKGSAVIISFTIDTDTGRAAVGAAEYRKKNR